ncbi:uncharacterized protein LOC131841839 [Achroia grisella]|uniref:uncharacterized protein LOC131841839 n=1 Tax=Achroia grisella TaxID=688607 RepID=UPI0027D28DFD|nr:uncharacterized protein LOC131841839 [Achroia grisella]
MCLNLKKDEWKKTLQKQKNKWLCPLCSSSRPKGDNSNTPIRPTNNALEDIQEDLEKVNTTRGSRIKSTNMVTDSNVSLSDLMNEIRKLREEVSEIPALRKELVDVRSQILSIANSLNETLADHKKKLNDAQVEISNLKGIIQNSQRELEILEQNALCNELEIVGIPESGGEDLMSTIITTSNKLGVDLKETDVCHVTRVGARLAQTSSSVKEIKARPILVKMVRRAKKEEIIKASKAHKKLTTEGIKDGLPKPVYINERLTRKNKQLFREARLRSRKYNFQFCWVRNGFIYIRQCEKKPAFRIQCFEDVDEKIGPALDLHVSL